MKKAYKRLKLPTRKWINKVKSTWQLDDHHQRILILAGQAWDRAQDAKILVDTDGSTIKDRFGQMKPHPMIEVERQIARGEEAQALRSEISALRQSQIFAQQQTMQHLQEQKESSQRAKFGNFLMQQGFEMMRGSEPKARINCTDHYFGTDCTVR